MVTVNTSEKIDTIVQTTRGAVRGAWENGIAVFRGIPYAEPPVGKLRFKPPVPRQRWDGMRDATHFGASAPQDRSILEEALTGGYRQPQGDDCLNLNVWSPDLDRSGLPVMVWIHGGSFKWGAGSDAFYDGATFARAGIVTVTLNYRLNALGFLYVGNRPGSGNFGLLDQLAALEWVQENIAAFGGDPSQVTVAGESAGGHCIGELLAAPASQGLFHRGILQSGAASVHKSVEVAAIIGTAVLGRLGVRLGDDDALATLTNAALIEAAVAVEPESLKLVVESGLTPTPLMAMCSDFTWPAYGTDVLPEPALVPIAGGAARDIDLLVGWNADECSWMRDAVNTPSAVADAAFRPTGRTGASILDVYRRNRPDLSDRDATTPILTDTLFRIPAIRLAEAAQRHNPRTYMYRFAWGSPASDGKFGAAHGFEVPFMWDTLNKAQYMIQLMAQEPPQALATTMHGAWVNFIKTGSPQHPNLPEWPAYDTTRRATMDLDVESHIVEDPDGEERRLWDGVQY
jgi:para-nitrobenzyl esterase